MDALIIAIPLQQQRQQKALINKNFIWKFFFFSGYLFKLHLHTKNML